MNLPLEGIRVLEFSMFLPGPFCTQILADYGAEVIKIEQKGGERGRWNKPYIDGQNARFYSVNRNKKSIILDLKKKEGKTVFKKLVINSDVILDGSRPETMERLGLSYGDLEHLNKGLIYCSISSFGITGPYYKKAAHDINLQSLAGVLGLNASKDGTPVLSPVHISASAGSLYAVAAILIALVYRFKTGQGQLCDISELDGTISLLAYTLGEWSGRGKLLKIGDGTLTGGQAFYHIYKTSDDKYISLAAAEDRAWEKFCRIISRPEYIPLQKNWELQQGMIAGIQAIFREKTQAEWVKTFFDTDIPVNPVLGLGEMCEHPQVKARDMIINMTNFLQSGNDMILTGLPIKFSNSPGKVKLTFPKAGEHTAEILSAIGYNAEDIKLLMEKEVVCE